MITSIFWNTSHKRSYERAGDPLGFDALREAWVRPQRLPCHAL